MNASSAGVQEIRTDTGMTLLEHLFPVRYHLLWLRAPSMLGLLRTPCADSVNLGLDGCQVQEKLSRSLNLRDSLGLC